MKFPLTCLGCLVLLLFTAAAPAWAGGSCEVAWQVAQQASARFAKDRAAGLKLFVEAQRFCPDDVGLDYDLGMAYARYGRPDDAVTYLEKAVRGGNAPAMWRNNLAAMLLQIGKHPQRALALAREAAAKEADKPQVQLTLVNALAANGDDLGALRTAAKAKAAFSDNRAVASRYEALLNAYLAAALGEIRQGRTETGLAALKKADFAPEAVVVRCEALERLGRFDEALTAGAVGRRKYPAKKEDFDRIENGVFARLTHGYYEEFQRGNMVKAYAAAKDLAEKYPGNPVVEKTKKDLWKALLADSNQIDIPAPKPMAQAPTATESVQTQRLLAGIGSAAAPTGKVDLSVDVDARVPKGAVKHPDAVAVVIGNQDYARSNHGIGDVRWAGHDAAMMKKYLVEEMGYDPANIIFVKDATSGELRNIFGSKDHPRGQLYNYVRPGKSDVFVYYVGHGAPGPDGKSAYLVPVDAEADFISNNGYPLNLFYRVLRNLPAKSEVVVLDACFSGDSPSGSLFKKISPAMLRNIRPVQKVARGVVFSSADKNQVATWYPAKHHSLFTYFFLKGLDGKADGNHDGRITAGEMERYLKSEVPYWARREANRVQTPLMMGNRGVVLATLR